MAKKDDGLVAVVYVGKKTLASDNVAHSGRQWDGRGDVQRVTPEQAAILFRYPDQWQPESKSLPRDGEIERALLSIEPPKGAVGIAGKRIEHMDERELCAHAKHYYGVDLDPKLSQEELLAKLNEVVIEAGLEAEIERNNAIGA